MLNSTSFFFLKHSKLRGTHTTLFSQLILHNQIICLKIIYI